MMEDVKTLVEKHCLTNRSAVGEDIDALVADVKKALGCDVLEVPSGEKCLTWIIPKHWKVRKGRLAKTTGETVVDFADNPLHLWTHSVSFQGEVTRDQLEEHLFSDPSQPDWVPFHYRNGFRFDAEQWGFCLSHNQRLSLKDESYLVEIDTDLDTNGTMKVADCHLKGSRKETVFFAAHTCHQGIATDGLTCVAAGVELFKRLQKREGKKYSYRLILGPEYFAAAGFLAKRPEEDIEYLKAGIYLDMLGNNQPLGFQYSFQGNSHMDRILENVFDNYVEHHIRKGYRKLWGNDEMFYDGPGYWIPTPGIGGGRHPEYHFDQDNADFVNYSQVEKSIALLEKIIDVLETDFVPIPKFKGPIYLSGYDLYIDPKIDPKGYDNLNNIQILMDGRRSCLDIACKLGIDFFFVRNFCDKLEEKELVEKRFVNRLAG